MCCQGRQATTFEHQTGESLQTIFNPVPCLWGAIRKASALQERLFYATHVIMLSCTVHYRFHSKVDYK